VSRDAASRQDGQKEGGRVVIEFQRNAAAGPVGIDARLADLLARSSRTFALSIPLLEQPLRDEVTVAYLLFRIADTIEDEVDWPDGQRARVLRLFAAFLAGENTTPAASAVLDEISGVEVAHEGYAKLMGDALFVLDAYAALDDAPREAIAAHLVRTSLGMADQLESPGAPEDVRGAKHYCYAVAGIVGELCTELFVLRNASLARARNALVDLAPAFGEGLQLVNILRDEAADAIEGRRFIPASDCRAELLALAGDDLRAAGEYVRLLETHGASAGTVAFNALNVALACETLSLVADRGAGVKVARERVTELFEDIRARVAAAEPICPVLDRVLVSR